MPATGILQDAISATTAALTALGLKVIDDPRQARPYCVMVELPVLDAFTSNVGDITITIKVLGIPPANKTAAEYLLTTVDAIMNSNIAITDARPSTADYGGGQFPTYDITSRIAVRRN
jgi:ABC-type Zn uptake system ZnuABC Zn-binding protein ZnuA